MRVGERARFKCSPQHLIHDDTTHTPPRHYNMKEICNFWVQVVFILIASIIHPTFMHLMLRLWSITILNYYRYWCVLDQQSCNRGALKLHKKIKLTKYIRIALRKPILKDSMKKTFPRVRLYWKFTKNYSVQFFYIDFRVFQHRRNASKADELS